MAAPLPPSAGLIRFQENEFRMDRFANGSDTETWETADGTEVPSIQKFLKDNKGRIDDALAEAAPLLEMAEIVSFSADTKSQASALDIDETINSIFIKGGTYVGDGLGGLYIDTNNGSADTFTSVGGRVWYRSADQGRDFAITLTVGSGGQYATINAALAAATLLGGPRYKKGGLKVEVRLLTGFVMAEQVLADNVDLGFITITSQDAVVTINQAAITENLGSAADLVIPAFGGINGAVLPRIGALFTYPDNTTSMDGVGLLYGAKATILPECGIQKCRQGIVAFYGSEVYCHPIGVSRGDFGSGAGTVKGADFRNAKLQALYLSNGSRASLARSNFNDCGHTTGAAVFAIWDSHANIYQSEVKRAAQTAILARDGSTINARETDVRNAGLHGYHAYHGARINARYYADSPAGGEGCSGASGYGVCASTNSHIEADGMKATGCGVAFRASECSTLDANGANGSGSTRGAQIESASVVNLKGANLSGCANIALEATGASTVDFQAGNANNCLGEAAVRAWNSSRINCKSVTATGAAQWGLVAIEGGEITADGATVTGSVAYSLYAHRGSKISARSAVAGTTAATGIRVENGSIINANSATGTLSQTANTPTGSGIIFQ